MRRTLAAAAVILALLPGAVHARTAQVDWANFLIVRLVPIQAGSIVEAHARVSAVCSAAEITIAGRIAVGQSQTVGGYAMVTWVWHPIAKTDPIAFTCTWKGETVTEQVSEPLPDTPTPIAASTQTPKPTVTPIPPKPTPTVGGAIALMVVVSVTPNPMKYNTNPATLTARTSPGAMCKATVLYSTGKAPRSFNGHQMTADASGMVSWQWHEETKGVTGTATVDCTLGATSAEGTADFIVD